MEADFCRVHSKCRFFRLRTAENKLFVKKKKVRVETRNSRMSLNSNYYKDKIPFPLPS